MKSSISIQTCAVRTPLWLPITTCIVSTCRVGYVRPNAGSKSFPSSLCRNQGCKIAHGRSIGYGLFHGLDSGMKQHVKVSQLDWLVHVTTGM